VLCIAGDVMALNTELLKGSKFMLDKDANSGGVIAAAASRYFGEEILSLRQCPWGLF
jgi:hypothetical protein